MNENCEIIESFKKHDKVDYEFSTNSNPSEYFMRRKMWTQIMQDNSKEWTLVIKNAKISVQEKEGTKTDVIPSCQDAQNQGCPPEILLEYGKVSLKC